MDVPQPPCSWAKSSAGRATLNEAIAKKQTLLPMTLGTETLPERPLRRLALQPEQALMVRLARVQVPFASHAPVGALLERSDLRWDWVVRQARAHQVGPLIHHHLQALFPELVPSEAKEKLRALFHARLRRSLLLKRTLPQLLAHLERQGVQAIPFKGPVLAARAYSSNEHLRAFGDLDLLVRPQDARRAAAALEAAGFEATRSLPSRLTSPERGYLPWQDRHGNAIGFVRDEGTPGEVPVDLHWGLASHYFQFPMTPETLRKRLVPVALEPDLQVQALSPEDLLLFLCAHATKHRWKALSFVCDIAELIRSSPALDWAQTLDQARACGSERMLLVGSRLARTLLSAPVPPSVRGHARVQPEEVAALAREAQALLFDSGPETKPLGQRLGNALRVSRFHVRIRDRRWDGLGAALHHLRLVMAPTPEDRAWLDLPERLSFLYVPLRGLRIISESLRDVLPRPAFARDRMAKLGNGDLKKIASLRFQDAGMLLRMLWLLARLAVLEHTLPLPALVRAFDPHSSGAPPPDGAAPTDGAAEEEGPSEARVRRMVRLSRALSRRLYRERFCMKLALVRFYFLRKWNYPARICFGVSKLTPEDNLSIAGHAWIEVEGTPAFEGDDPRLRHATTYAYPSP